MRDFFMRWPLRYGLAAFAVAVATGAHFWLPGFLITQPLPTFFVATLLVSLLIGWGPGLLAISLSAATAAYFFFLQPLHSVALHVYDDLARLAVFVTLGLGFNALAESMRRRAGNTVFAAEIGLTELKLHGAELRLKLAADSAGIGVFDWDPCTGQLSLDERARAHWGLSGDAAIDFDGFIQAVHVDDRSAIEGALNRALDPQGPGAFSAEFLVVGVHDLMERWISAAGQAAFHDGRVSRFIGATRDRTDRKRAESALRASEERFYSLTQALPGLIFECDATGATVFASDQWNAYTGMPARQSLNQGWTRAVHPDDLEESMRRWNKALEDGDLCEMRHRLRAADGSYRWFIVRAIPQRDGRGRLVRWVGSCTDIENLVRAETALTEANRRKDEFLAMLAHELRNPLASIRNAVYVLHKLDGDCRKSKESNAPLLMIERQIDHLVYLVDDLLDVSRLTHGKINLRKERADLCEILRHALDTSQPALKAGGQRLIVNLPSEPLIVEADSVRLVQVFANLLNNAAKYTERDGQIWLEAERSGNEAIVRVRDNGVGISPDTLPHVFDLFTQESGAEGRKQGGLGIGLTLVRGLVQLHGGGVEARSEGPNKGSEFVVRLPVAASPLSENGLEAATTPEPGVRRALVIDDDHDVANSLTMLLRVLGCEVRTAYDGFGGVAALAEFEAEIVFLDLGMPKIDGYETARRIRGLPKGAQLMLVALTGWGQNGDRERTREAGFDRHLTKPVPVDVLEDLLRQSCMG
jgi:PAS domain S-box-containing protein